MNTALRAEKNTVDTGDGEMSRYVIKIKHLSPFIIFIILLLSSCASYIGPKEDKGYIYGHLKIINLDGDLAKSHPYSLSFYKFDEDFISSKEIKQSSFKVPPMSVFALPNGLTFKDDTFISTPLKPGFYGLQNVSKQGVSVTYNFEIDPLERIIEVKAGEMTYWGAMDILWLDDGTFKPKIPLDVSKESVLDAFLENKTIQQAGWTEEMLNAEKNR